PAEAIEDLHRLACACECLLARAEGEQRARPGRERPRLQAGGDGEQLGRGARLALARTVVALQLAYGGEVRARPTLEARIADGAALVDRAHEMLRGLGERTRAVGQDVAEVDVGIGRRLLGTQRLAMLQARATQLL